MLDELVEVEEDPEALLPLSPDVPLLALAAAVPSWAAFIKVFSKEAASTVEELDPRVEIRLAWEARFTAVFTKLVTDVLERLEALPELELEESVVLKLVPLPATEPELVLAAADPAAAWVAA